MTRNWTKYVQTVKAKDGWPCKATPDSEQWRLAGMKNFNSPPTQSSSHKLSTAEIRDCGNHGGFESPTFVC